MKWRNEKKQNVIGKLHLWFLKNILLTDSFISKAFWLER